MDEETNKIYRINETKQAESKNICNTISSSCLSKFLNHLSVENRIQLEKNLLNVANVFTNDKFDTGTVKNHEATIELIENKYVAKKPYRCSLPDQKEIESQISKLLKSKLIENSCSPYASPVTLAYKKEDKRRSRLCIDYRDLNKLIVPESQPFPRIDDILVKTKNCRWYTVVDLNSAFWSIPISKKDRYKTAFVTQNGHFQWCCLPFGLKNSPAIFQRVLSNVIRENNLDKFCSNYIDDIIIFSETFQNHIQHICKLLKVLLEEGFRVKLEKCDFAKQSVKYLGHILGINTVRPSSDNLIAIKEFPQPSTKKQIRQFLGKINFYHEYIPKYSEILEPLHNLLRNNVVFVWSDSCEKSFSEIKKYLSSGPILSIFDPEKETVIYTDASGIGLGAILKQKQENGILLPVAYFSKKLTAAQKKKKAIYLECLAIKLALHFWRHWLLGIRFTVYSDHKPLENLKIKSRTDEELGDMTFYLSQFNFKIIYLPGINNQEADALSRNPVLEDFEITETENCFINLIGVKEIIDDQKKINENNLVKNKIINKNGVRFIKIHNKERILISKDLGKLIIEKIHNYYGHVGPNKILEKIRSSYYFPKLDEEVKSYCNSCQVCKKNKTRREKKIGLLSHLGPATKPYEIMSLDTTGGFSGYNSSHKYFHLLTDHFTRYAYASTSKSQTTNDFIKLLSPIIEKNEIKILLADQYPALNSSKFKAFLDRNNITLLYTAVDCPFSNGLTERLGQTLVNRLRCKINDKNQGKPWTSLFKKCLEEYNQTTHGVTGFSPEYLLNGTLSPIIPSEFIEAGNLEEDRKLAFQNSIRNHDLNKKRVDKTRKIREFEIGEMVYVDLGNKLNRNKLDEVRQGPYKVIKRLSDSIYEIKTKQNRKADFFHISKIVPFYDRNGGM